MEQGLSQQTAPHAHGSEGGVASGSPRTGRRHETARVDARHDLYAFVHKGLRACMSDTLLAVGRMDTADRDDVRATVARVRDLLEMCGAHLDKEERYVHPAMEARRPGSATRTAQDHVDQAPAVERIEAELQAIESGAGDAHRLYRHLALFIADNYLHMHAEETENNAVLWATCDDAELALIEKEIVASIPPGLRARWLRWMVQAMAPTERLRLLAGMKVGVPAPAFAALIALVRPHLAAGEWEKLAAALAL